METVPADTVSAEGVQPEPKGRSLKIAIVAVIIIVVVLSASLAYWWLSRPQEPTGPTGDWFFKGAYAQYSGQGTVLYETISLSMRLEIADLNSTHLKLLVHLKMDSESLGTLSEEQDTTWVPLEEASFSMEETAGTEGMTFERSYKDNVYIEGLGTRYCEVHEYTMAGVGNMIIYFDPEITWPLKISYSLNVLGEDMNFDLTLVQTNIPALQ